MEDTYKVRMKCTNCYVSTIRSIPLGKTVEQYIREHSNGEGDETRGAKCENCGCYAVEKD